MNETVKLKPPSILGRALLSAALVVGMAPAVVAPAGEAVADSGLISAKSAITAQDTADHGSVKYGPYYIGNATDGSAATDSVQANIYADGTMVFSGSGDTFTSSDPKSYGWFPNGYNDIESSGGTDITKSVTSVVFEDGVKPTSLQGYFQNFVNLKDITIPSSVTDLTSTFNLCASLETAPAIPSGVTVMKNTFRACTALKTVPNLPSGLVDLAGAFYGCSSLETAPVIPDSVTNLEGAFASCTKLTKAPAIPSDVTNVQKTFQDCTSLTEAPVLPSGLKYMNYTFQNCAKLTILPKDFTVPSSNLSTVNSFLTAGSPYNASNKLKTYCDESDYDKLSQITFWSNWSRELVKLPTVDSLKQDITIAKAKLDAANVSEDGSGLEDMAQYWTDATAQALRAAIDSAEQTAKGNALTAQQLIGTSTDLQAAIETFDASVRYVGIMAGPWNIGATDESSVVAMIRNDGTLAFEGSGNTKTFTQSNLPWKDNLNKIKAVEFGENVKPTDISIFFANCENLSKVNRIPDSVTNLTYAFIGCRSLSYIPKGSLACMIKDGAKYEYAFGIDPNTIKSSIQTYCDAKELDELNALTTTTNTWCIGRELVARGDRTELDASVATAKAALKGVTPSADGSDVETESQWATQDKIDALKEAVEAAEAMGENGTDEEFTNAKSAVDAAIGSLDAKAGTKKAPTSEPTDVEKEAAEKAAAEKAAAEKAAAEKAAAEKAAAEKAAAEKAAADKAAAEKAAAEKAAREAAEKEAAEKAATAGLAKGEEATTGTGAAAAKVEATSATEVVYEAPASKSTKKVTVPATVTVNGKAYKVTSVAAGAFKNSKATSVTVGSNVKTIGANAFNGAKKLKTLTLGKNVKNVGKNVLKGAKKLKTVTLKTSKITKKSLKNLLKGSKVKTLKLKGVSKKAKKNYKKWAKAYGVKVK